MSTFGVLITTRAFFPGFLALDAREIVLRRLEKMGHRAILVGENDTRYGAIENADDAKKCAELFKAHRDEIEGVLVILPNFGDEVAVSSTLDMAKLDVPVLVAASDDEKSKMDLAHRRDSFCGKLSLTANLYQYGIKFTNTHTHTLTLDSDDFDREIDFFDIRLRLRPGPLAAAGDRRRRPGARRRRHRRARRARRARAAGALSARAVPAPLTDADPAHLTDGAGAGWIRPGARGVTGPARLRGGAASGSGARSRRPSRGG